MRFLVDAHLPMRLVYWLRERGHDVIHTRELPLKNETDDIDIIQLSVDQDRIVIFKDEDFFKYFHPERTAAQTLKTHHGKY